MWIAGIKPPSALTTGGAFHTYFLSWRNSTLTAVLQVRFAGQLGVSQQTVTAYESGNRRVPISHLPRLAALLGTSIEELIGEPPKAAKRGPTPKLQQQLEQVQSLPKAKQRIVSEVLDSLLAANR
jgi:transcriptional regulator with XRE-family HTH domain